MGEIRPIEQVISIAEQRWPHLQFDRKNSHEASSACPFCGKATEDGFLIFEDMGYFCRQCSTTGWVDDDKSRKLSEKELMDLRIRRLERKQKEQEERLKRLEEMHQCTDHLLYHRNLTSKHREYWYKEGIFDEAIDSFQLGYTSKCPTAPHSPSYTIPVYDINNQLCNIRHRLVDESEGKYRPHLPNLPQQLFNAPVLTTPRDRITLLEGEKKCVCLSQHGFLSVGIMGKSFSWQDQWFEWFRPHREIVIALDPDAKENAWELGQMFAREGFNNVKVARFPVKPDDAIAKWGAGYDDIEEILRKARPV